MSTNSPRSSLGGAGAASWPDVRRAGTGAAIRPPFYTPKVHCFFVRVSQVVVDEMFFAHRACPYRTPDGRRRRFRLDEPARARRTRGHRRDGGHRARPATDCSTTGTASRGARTGAGRPAEASGGPGARTGWRTGGGGEYFRGWLADEEGGALPCRVDRPASCFGRRRTERPAGRSTLVPASRAAGAADDSASRAPSAGR
jgi:hypothetical protein